MIKRINAKNKIVLNIPLITLILSSMAFFLIITNVGVHLIRSELDVTGNDYLNRFLDYFDVNKEQNIPTYFSSLILFFSGLLITVITILEKISKTANFTKWAVLAFCFLYMSIDEAISLHEKLIFPMRQLLGDIRYGIFYYTWIIPYSLIVIIFLRFYLQLKKKTKLYFSTGAALYVVGAIGIEFVEGLSTEIYGYNLTSNLIGTFQESLEMAGVIVFIKGLMEYISDNYHSVQFKFTSANRQVSSEIQA